MPSAAAVRANHDPAIADIARRLVEAARTRTPITPIAGLLPPGDVAGAYAVQELVTAGRLAEGRRIVGRKIGLTAVAVQKQLGVDSPDYGALFDDMQYASGETIPWRALLQPKVEAEIAFGLARPLGADALTLDDVARAVAWAAPAIEVVSSRIADWKIGLVDTIADNASAGAFVVAASRVALADFDPRLAGMAMSRRGEDISLGVGAACLGHPLVAVLWLARTMAGLGEPLREGDIVMSGALGPMVAVAPGDVVRAEIGGLGAVDAVFGADGAGA